MSPDTAILDSRYAWTRLALSLVIATVGSAGIWSIVVVMPAIQADFGVARGDVSLPYTLTMLGFALGNLVIGRIVDRFGITVTLIASALLIAAATGMAALSPSVPVLTGLQFVIGFGSAVGFGPLIADVSQWFLRRRGIAVAIAASGNYLAGAVWPVILAGVLAGQGWRAVYLVLAASTLAIVIPLAFFLRRRVPLAARAHADTLSIARASATGLSPRMLMLLLGLAGIGCCVAMSMPQVHIVSYCVDLGYGPAVGSQMLSLMLLGGVASRLVSGLLADRLGGVRTLLIGSGLQCLALFLYLPSDGLTSLYIVSLVFGLAQGGIVPSYAVIVREYMPSEEAGRRVGFVLMGTILGMALGGWMSGWIYDLTGSYKMAFLNGIAWNFLNIGIMVLILMRTRTRSPSPLPA
ncbi:Sugar phosphate permease [Roseovarius azorensis]|uniref:Sugar phosphate permease n=1 Tax=Roseovarius azorensis TaxID=1287727 RepID=A0A1H7WP54_9RHOB|nr:MFS transporter [Roseovarius azorensis]SEM23231.1 Sugar phosphate permease [Roseovarius azorensis]